MSVSTQIRQAGLRATTPRVAILGWLAKHRRPVRVEAVWGQLKPTGIDRVTVYRTMETLARSGLVRNVDLGHGHAHYEINDPAKHHHHLVCESCGDVKDVTVQGEIRLINAATRRHNFKTKSHSFEIFGLCEDCQT